LESGAHEAARLLKALANENRLLILCHLSDGEKSVGELEELLRIGQPNLSQQLARLRHEGLVTTRRSSRTIYYCLGSPEAEQVLEVLHRLFCAKEAAGAAGERAHSEY
jgi:ArsR family transcriptional regulator